jgi:O-antigen/teichoic acid export membrane protein
MLLSQVRRWLREFGKSTLLVNAVYLLLSTLVVAASGFLFWVVVAHAYSAAAVGLATTMLSVSSLLSLLGLAGFDATFVRFLPGSDRKNEYINSGLIVVTITSAVFAACSAIALPLLIPSLSVLGTSYGFAAFVFFTVMTSLNVLTNAVFLAFKQVRALFVITVLLSLGKIILPLVIARGSALTIFVLAGSAQLVGLVLSIAWMRRTCNYTFLPRIDMTALRTVSKFSFSVYASSILNLAPPTLLPLLIIHQIGPEDVAYYYMAFTIAGVLYTIAYASMQSVFAEGSHDETALKTHVSKAVRFIGAILIPAALVVAIVSSLLLTIFGDEYAHGAAGLLRLFALGALPVAAYSALGAMFKVTKNLRGVVGMNIVYAVVILSLSYIFVPHLGLIGIGWAWLAGNLAAVGVGLLSLRQNQHLLKRKRL